LDDDLLLVNVLSVILVLLVFLMPESPLRVALGIPFVLFFPGYTLTCALFPKTNVNEYERLALGVGLSLSVVPLLALGLNFTPWKIRLYPVMFMLLLFTLSMSVIASLRRRALSVEEVFSPKLDFKVPRWREMSKPDKILACIILVGLVATGGFAAYLASAPKVGDKFTEFYVLGSGGKFGGYPKNMTLGESRNMTLGIVSHEYGEAGYRAVIEFDGETIQSFDGIRLDHEDTWRQNFTFTPSKTGRALKLEFLLYMDGGAEPYRTLQLFITVKPWE